MRFRSFLESVSNSIWYHGTWTPDIKKFDTRRHHNKIGAYFTDDKKTIPRIHGSVTKYIYTVRITPTKILDLSKYKEDEPEGAQFLDELPVSDTFKRTYLQNSGQTVYPYKMLEYADNHENIIPKLKRQNYDAIIFMENGARTIAALTPSIIEILKIESTLGYGYKG